MPTSLITKLPQGGLMAVYSQPNPLGLDGLEFIEFASSNVQILETLMSRLGMVQVARHKSRPLRLFRQNDVNFVINDDKNSFAARFAAEHGPAACATGFRVENAQEAFELAVERGAKPFTDEAAKSGWNLPAIYGIGNSLVYFVDQYCDKGEIYDDGNWEWITSDRRPVGKGLRVIDHMTNNVPRGEMQKWCDFYTNIFGFEERRYFDIKGKSTGLFSKVMKSPCNRFSIPINEPQDSKSQIQEYLDEYKGSGIQHIALLTGDIVESVSTLRADGIEFLAAPPETYYKAIPNRVPNVREPMEPLQKHAILIDGDKEGYLLQIFTKNQVGPIFIEIIQRANHDGFGDGNFQALFDAMEEDQRLRGVL
jgi:4-hydroxyphenylpyruvate dioxygenase